MKPVLIAPSIIAADFSNLRSECARIDQSGADLLHVDIMDGHFVPNITFGPAVVKTIKSLIALPLDVHLMISHPRQYIAEFVKAGAANITFHIECEDVIRTAIDEIVYYSRKVGLAVKPRTPLSAVKEHLGAIDRLLIMTVEPGFGGQKFMPDMMAKVEQAVAWRKESGFKYDIEVDGGLTKYTIWPAVRAGAEVIVAGTSVFSQVDVGEAIQDLRDNAKEALAYLRTDRLSGRTPGLYAERLGVARHQPEQIREAVEIPDDEKIDLVDCRQLRHQPFRAAAGRPGHIERGGSDVRARRGPAIEGDFLLLDFRDQIVEVLQHLRRQLGILVLRVTLRILRRDRQFAHQRDQLLLDEQQLRFHQGQFRLRARHAERGVQLIDRAVSLHSQVVFLDAAAIHQACFPLVSGTCGDRHA